MLLIGAIVITLLHRTRRKAGAPACSEDSPPLVSFQTGTWAHREEGPLYVPQLAPLTTKFPNRQSSTSHHQLEIHGR